MIDFCRCKGCSSDRQLSKLSRQSFPKKLLVAVTIVVILAMCVMPAEARHLPDGHRRRHRRPEHTESTKEMRLMNVDHRRRHAAARELERRPEMMQMKARPLRRPRGPRIALNDLYYNETKKVLTKLRNTRTFFVKDKEMFERYELSEYKNTIPPWLPTVSFVKLHKENYKNVTRFGRLGVTIPERRYRNLMPKLYKSLVEYEEIFKRLRAVELNFPDDPYNTYRMKRKQILNNTLFKLYSTIQEVNDSMASVNLTLPTFNKKLNLSTLETKVDATQCYKNDYIALRGYGNLLNDWFFELKCSKGKNLNRDACKRYEAKLIKKGSRRKGNRIARALAAT